MERPGVSPSAGRVRHAHRMSIDDRPAGRILVVEDDRVQAEFLAQVLRLEAYAVSVARTGTEARVNANASPQPYLVLVDVGLPDLSGTELVRRLRAAST